MKMLLTANHALLEQAVDLMSELDNQTYCRSMQAYGSGSIGQHLRHVLDHYQAILNIADNIIDYDCRRRHNQIENNRLLAIAEIQYILRALPELVDKTVYIRAEISPLEQQVAMATSTLQRELLFVTSHAVHHFALIAILLRLQGRVVPVSFGVAPATLSYQRALA